MEINWSTLILEIINFLILVWILKYFLYAPIKKAIMERKEHIQQELVEAEKMRNESKELQKKYENRLLDWEKEKEKIQINFQHEMEEERTKKLAALENILRNEKEKNKALEKRRIFDIINKKEKESIVQAMKFSSRLLTQLSCPELESKIIDLFLDDFTGFSEKDIQTIKHEIGKQKIDVEISTVFQLPEEKKNSIISIIQKKLGDNFVFNFILNPQLLAGLYIELGSIVFHVNLRDELKFFSEVSYRE